MRDPCAKTRKLRGILQVIHDLDKLFLFLVSTRHVGEGDLVLVIGRHLDVCLAKAAHSACRSATACRHHLLHGVSVQSDDHDDDEDVGQECDPPGIGGHGDEIGILQDADAVLLGKLLLDVGHQLLTGGGDIRQLDGNGGAARLGLDGVKADAVRQAAVGVEGCHHVALVVKKGDARLGGAVLLLDLCRACTEGDKGQLTLFVVQLEGGDLPSLEHSDKLGVGGWFFAV